MYLPVILYGAATEAKCIRTEILQHHFVAARDIN